MRYLILSDIHSNWEALEAVLAEARGLYDRIVCCGDLTGYGPDPNRVVDWARENLSAVIRGNHDRVCCGHDNLETFNPVARAASLWTREQLTPQNLAWLQALEQGPLAVDGFLLIHGSPLDEDEYVMSLMDARNVFGYLELPVGFFGHTHMQGGFSYIDRRYGYAAQLNSLDRAQRNRIVVRLDPAGFYLINPGSVGQPRDGDARAGWAIYDSEAQEVRLHRTPYDWDTTCRKVIAAGLPEALGTRLTKGR